MTSVSARSEPSRSCLEYLLNKGSFIWRDLEHDLEQVIKSMVWSTDGKPCLHDLEHDMERLST